MNVTENVAKQGSIALVIALVGKDLAEDWWNRPNRAFDMKTPAEIWLDDHMRVYNYLMHHGFVGGGS